MKRSDLSGGLLGLLMVSMLISPMKLNAQDEETASLFDVGLDFVSSYIWRGTKFGTGPAVQPSIELATGGFAVGGWGNYNFTADEGAEADICLSYSFKFGLSIGVTDYYFPGTEFFDFSTENGAQAFEVNLGYEYKGFLAAANYFINEAGGAGNEGGDLYFELGYGFKYFAIHFGAGNGWHTVEDENNPNEADFNICNIGISSSKDIKITESFSLPLFGAVILNPDTKQFHVVAGVSF
ncbi:MAG: hypothetical protein GQ579_01790 [Bacteroidales bacterium]|nr:hypothetical protein [Bacteroidales bacterium]